MFNAFLAQDLLCLERAQLRRAEALTNFGRQVARAPKRLIRFGIDDFRRYRRGGKS